LGSRVRLQQTLCSTLHFNKLEAVASDIFAEYVHPGHRALPWQEGLVTALFMSVGLACVGSTLLFLWGLRKSAV